MFTYTRQIAIVFNQPIKRGKTGDEASEGFLVRTNERSNKIETDRPTGILALWQLVCGLAAAESS